MVRHEIDAEFSLSLPTSRPGTFLTIWDNGGGSYTTVPQLGMGGGPLSHVPLDVASQIFSAQDPHGWYLTTPVGVGQYQLDLVDRNGASFGTYTYPPGAIASGIPLAHSGNAMQGGFPGFVWIPYQQGAACFFEMVDGPLQLPWPPQVVGYFISQNFPGQTQYKPVNTPWGSTTLVYGFTNDKAAHGQYFRGY